MHLVEEMKNASKEAPVCAGIGLEGALAKLTTLKRVIVWSMIFCSVTSWLSAILLLWTAGNWEEYMLGTRLPLSSRPCTLNIDIPGSIASQPYMNWWMDICNSVYGGGIFCALIMIGLNFFIIVGTNNAGSRLAWSMARDKAFPYSEYFAHVSKRFHIPLRAMIAILVVDLFIGKYLVFHGAWRT